MKKRVLSLLLAALMLSSSFVACAGDGDAGQPGTNVTTAAPDTTLPPETEPVDARDTADLPDGVIPADGFTLRLLTRDASLTALTELAPQTETGETLNDALYNRYEKLLDKYGIKIEKVIAAKIAQTFSNAVLANSDDFEGAFNAMSGTATLAQTGQAVDLMTLEHIDLTKNYWDQSALEQMSVAGKMYFGIGDIHLAEDDNLMVMLYNTELAKEVGVENLYTAVEEGRWTYDLMLKYVDQVSNDVDGDGQMGANDVIGYLYASNNCLAPHLAATNTTFITKNNEDIPQFNADVDRLQSIFEMLNKLHDPTQNAMDWLSVGKADAQVPFITGMVSNKQVLFQNMVLSQLRRLYPEVTADFGVLPMPKLNEQQEHYHSTVLSDSSYVITVPTSNPRLEQTGYAIEAMAECSGDLTDAYYEICLASKYTRDPESFDMIRIAREHVVYDPMYLYSWGKVYSTLNGAVKARNENTASTIATLTKVAEQAVEDFVQAVKKWS